MANGTAAPCRRAKSLHFGLDFFRFRMIVMPKTNIAASALGERSGHDSELSLCNSACFSALCVTTCEVPANAPPSTTPVPLLAVIIVLNSHGVAGNEAAVCIEYGGTNG